MHRELKILGMSRSRRCVRSQSYRFWTGVMLHLASPFEDFEDRQVINSNSMTIVWTRCRSSR
jgi:hypothetical protein